MLSRTPTSFTATAGVAAASILHLRALGPDMLTARAEQDRDATPEIDRDATRCRAVRAPVLRGHPVNGESSWNRAIVPHTLVATLIVRQAGHMTRSVAFSNNLRESLALSRWVRLSCQYPSDSMSNETTRMTVDSTFTGPSLPIPRAHPQRSQCDRSAHDRSPDADTVMNQPLLLDSRPSFSERSEKPHIPGMPGMQGK